MRVLLVHGSIGKPFENWFPWLEKELSVKGVECIIPSFPTPEHQNYQTWERLMDYYCDIDLVNEDTVLIGHSCGAIFLVHYLLTHDIKISGLICVSGYNNFVSGFTFMDELNKSFYINLPELNVASKAKQVVALYGDNDPNIPQKYLEDFARKIGGQIICVPGAGHFNEAAGYTECDIILNILRQNCGLA